MSETLDVIKDGFADIKAQVDDGMARVNRRLDEQQKHITEVQAEQHTTFRPGSGARGTFDKAAIPEHLRKHIDRAEAEGRKNAVEVVAFGSWFQAFIQGSLCARAGRPADTWIKQKERIEKGWGYDHLRYEAIVKAAIGEVAGGGGNIIALPVEQELRRVIRDGSFISKLAQHISMSSLTHQIPVENANLTCFVIAEAGLVSDAYASNTTGFAQVPLTARKFGALVTMQNELLQDNIIGLQDYLFTAMGEGIGILEDQAAIEGSAGGVNFSGLESVSGINSFSVTGNTSGGDVPVYPDLVKAVFLASHRATRGGASWVMRPNVFRQVVGIVDTNGMPVFQWANVPNAIPERILGYGVISDSALSKTSAIKSGSYSIYFGPMNKIVFGDLAGIELAIDPYGLFTTYGTRLRVIKRQAITVPVGSFFTIARGVSLT